ncbi:MAG: hypothetical protein JW807_00915 [Spirochaetes bacterium]|nr:hypothetical protein [Spirochaetota bacterium]
MPIAYRQVIITKEEYDKAPPQFIVDLTAAMMIKADIENKKIQDAIDEARNK